MKKSYQLPEHRKCPVPAFLSARADMWEPCKDGMQAPTRLKCGLMVRHIRYDFHPLAGKSILFFSDLHVRFRSVLCIGPGTYITPGVSWLQRAFRELFEAIPQPNMILFGGDLAAEAALLGPAADFLADSLPHVPRFAVTGNWELRRIWLRPDDWAGVMKRAGFTLLRPGDPGVTAGDMELRALADFKEEQQIAPAPYGNPDMFHCTLMHNPDAVTALDDTEFLSRTHFMFAGHTHGGQLRLPGYGAIITSSRFGKHFEYGLYRHRECGTMLYVSAGIGTTWIPVRAFCPPEVVLLSFC